MDLSPQEIYRLHAYRKQGKWTNSVCNFLKVTGIYSTWLHNYSTFFNFPSRIKKKHKKPAKKIISTYRLKHCNSRSIRANLWHRWGIEPTHYYFANAKDCKVCHRNTTVRDLWFVSRVEHNFKTDVVLLHHLLLKRLRYKKPV